MRNREPQPAPHDIRVGPWRLLYRLGEGGMGVVHLAENDRGERAALKVLRPHVVGDEEARQRLAREVHSLGRVRSPRVAEIVDSDPWGPVPYVATRYVPGLSLHDHVPEEGPLVGADLVHFARALAEALQAVHRVGVLHRDIKPSNVLMEGRTPVLIDFGLARVAEDDRLTRTGWLLGTPGYLAPEILYGHEPTTAADVHSWAATVAFAGTGRAPFGRGPSMAVMDRVRRGEHDLTGLGPEVAGLVHAALDPEPGRRPTLPAVIHALGGTPTRDRMPAVVPDPTVVAGTRPLPGGVYDLPTRQQPMDTGPAAEETLATEPPTAVQAAVPPPQHAPYQTPPPPAPRVTVGERLRRWTLGLALLGVVATATAAAPYVAVAVGAAGVALLRWLSVVGTSAAERRRVRGPKWYDGVVTAASVPVDLVASLPGTFLLLSWTLALVGSGAMICLAAGVPTAQGLLALGVLLGIVTWTGPGARRVRSPLQRVAFPVARLVWPWLIALAVLVSVAGVLGWNAAEGVAWTPDAGAPWRSGTWLSRLSGR